MAIVGATLLLGGGGILATLEVGGSHGTPWRQPLFVIAVGAMVVGATLLLLEGARAAAAWRRERTTDMNRLIRREVKKARRHKPQLPSLPPDPTFRCQAIVMDDGRVDIALRSSHFSDPLHDLSLSKQQLRRGFEAACRVEMPEGRGLSLTPLRASCMVGETVTWTYPDDFDARASFDVPPFPLVTGHYTVKCEWRNPRGSRGLGPAMKEAARCEFYIGKTIPASSPEAKRTAVAMKVLRLAIDVLVWYVRIPTEMREADGDTPGERRLRAERDERVRQGLPPLIDRFRDLRPEIEALGIVAPDSFWEPETLQEAEAWERSLRGLVSALVRHG